MVNGGSSLTGIFVHGAYVDLDHVDVFLTRKYDDYLCKCNQGLLQVETRDSHYYACGMTPDKRKIIDVCGTKHYIVPRPLWCLLKR